MEVVSGLIFLAVLVTILTVEILARKHSQEEDLTSSANLTVTTFLSQQDQNVSTTIRTTTLPLSTTISTTLSTVSTTTTSTESPPSAKEEGGEDYEYFYPSSFLSYS